MDVFEHFIKDGSSIYAGNHVIADLWGVVNHTDENLIMNCFAQAAEDAGRDREDQRGQHRRAEFRLRDERDEIVEIGRAHV